MKIIYFNLTVFCSNNILIPGFLTYNAIPYTSSNHQQQQLRPNAAHTEKPRVLPQLQQFLTCMKLNNEKQLVISSLVKIS